MKRILFILLALVSVSAVAANWRHRVDTGEFCLQWDTGTGDIWCFDSDGDFSVTSDFVLGTGGLLDVNGIADGLVIDADADTTISAPTDDQIDIEVAGADDFTITANSFNVLSGSSVLVATGGAVDINGIADALVIDADGDTTISSPTDDQIDIEVSGADDFTITANTLNVLSGSTVDVEAGATLSVAAGASFLRAVEVVTAANVLTSAECGTTYFLNSATEFQTTLPAVSGTAGCYFKFIVQAAPATDGSYTVISGNSQENAIVIEVNELETDTNDDGPWDDDADVFTFVQDVSDEGDSVECVSNGTKWYCNGTVQNDGALTTGTT